MYFNPLHAYVPPSDSFTLSIVNVPFRNVLILPPDSEWSSWPVLLYHLINVVSFFRVQLKVSFVPMSITIVSIFRTSLSATITNTVSAQIGNTLKWIQYWHIGENARVCLWLVVKLVEIETVCFAYAYVQFSLHMILKQPFLNVAVLNFEGKKTVFGNICIIIHIWHVKKVMLLYSWCL